MFKSYGLDTLFLAILKLFCYNHYEVYEMKKYLLTENGNFYKANLHCHTTISDGKKSPEEIKKIYKDLGYSIVAYTDHDILIPHDDLTDNDFLALNSFEVEITCPHDAPTGFKCCHMCFIALDKDNITQPMWNENYLFGNAPNYKESVKYDKNEKPHIRSYDSECINGMIKKAKECGFFVTYNHPTWSRESYPEYISYEGMHAFEMFNGSCLSAGFDDYNPRVYDDMLRAGKKLFCIGADDNHNNHPETRKWDSGVAFTVIKADKLEYNTITKSLLDGNFYCSEGPEIKELWLEDGRIHVKCSNADRIVCSYQALRDDIVYPENAETLTYASFPVSKDWGFVRLTVIDKNGKHACTNAYYID